MDLRYVGWVAWTRSIGLRTGTGGGLLWRIFLFWLAEDPSASPEGLCSMELFICKEHDATERLAQCMQIRKQMFRWMPQQCSGERILRFCHSNLDGLFKQLESIWNWLLDKCRQIVLQFESHVKRLRRGFNHPPASRANVKERVELYLYYLYCPSWPVLGRKLLYIYILFYEGLNCNAWGLYENTSCLLYVPYFIWQTSPFISHHYSAALLGVR